MSTVGTLTAINQDILDAIFEAEVALRKSTPVPSYGPDNTMQMVREHARVQTRLMLLRTLFLPTVPTRLKTGATTTTHSQVDTMLAAAMCEVGRTTPVDPPTPQPRGTITQLHLDLLKSLKWAVSVKRSDESGWCWEVRNPATHIVAQGSGYVSERLATTQAHTVAIEHARREHDREYHGEG